MQRDIPIQPGETAVTAALRVVVHLAGGVVTSTTTGDHAKKSLHYPAQGARAVDIALAEGPTWDSPKLGAVVAQILGLVPLENIAELIWSGPGAVYVKNGKRVAPYAADAHHDHGHLAVVPTFTYEGPEVPMSPSEAGKQIIAAFPHEGGYVLVAADGAIYCFGCTYQGGLVWDAAAGEWRNR